MMEAGRIKHHLANNISEPKNTILIVGYCAPTTLGAKIGRGDKEVSIFGTVHEVKAEVKKNRNLSVVMLIIRNLSVFLNCQDKSAISRMFIVHGEYETQKKYVISLQEEGFKNIEIPAKGQEFEL